MSDDLIKTALSQIGDDVSVILDRDVLLRRLIARIQELEAKPVLKRLEWDNFDAWTWWAKGIGGLYSITERDGVWRVVLSRADPDADRSVIYEIDDFETAQAAAQSDHDEKILRWIMPPAPPSQN